MAGQRMKGMIVSIGGTPAPVIFSLNQSKPEFICFFISLQSKKMIEAEILPHLDFKPRHYDWIMTPNADLLSNCYSELVKHIPELMEKWEIKLEEVCVDYTGGTKTMSAALVLATIESSCCYSYVGGDERSKEGVGIVLDGREKRWFLDNPWDEIAAAEKKEVSILFNKARYASAAEVLDRCIPKVSKEQQPALKALKDMVRGYDFWDRFKHQEARTHLYKCREVLMAMGVENKGFKTLAIQIEGNIQFLQKLLAGARPSKYYFLDLLANARRRADLEHKFDDAVARIYRAIEVKAQIELQEGFGIHTSDVKMESIPQSLRAEFCAKYQDRNDKKIRIALLTSYRLLKELGNEIASNFFNAYEKKIKAVLDIRNSSILAHGFNAVGENTFVKLWEAIMDFSGAKEEEIPRFPSLKI